MKLKSTIRFIAGLTFVISVFWVKPTLAATPLSISYDYDYGLFSGGKSFYLQAGSAVYRERQGDTNIEVNFSVSAKEMNSLYSMTKLYNFSGIKTKSIKAYDRGGDTVKVTAGGRTVTKSNAGQSIVDGEFSRIRYDRIISNLQAFVKKKLAKEYQLFFIEMDSAYANHTPRVALDNEEVYLFGSEGDAPLLPGQHQLMVALYDNKGRNVKSEVFLVSTPSERIARVQVRGDDISVTTE